MTEGATRLQIQPDCIQKVTMHDYQLDGLNWLIGLYECSINGILADDMGLGKKLQAISLLGYLLQKKLTVGPHLIVVQKSSIDKWMKEFVDFCPSLHVVKFWEKNQYERALQSRKISMSFELSSTSWNLKYLARLLRNVSKFLVRIRIRIPIPIPILIPILISIPVGKMVLLIRWLWRCSRIFTRLFAHFFFGGSSLM